MSNLLRVMKFVNLVLSIPRVISLDGIVDYPTYRTDFCPLQKSLENGKISLRNALKGIVVTAAISTNIDEKNPPISVRMFNAIARRANFSVSYKVTGTPEGDEIWTDLLERNVNMYDISCGWWERRKHRLDRGILFVEEWYDADNIMIRKPPPSTDNTFNFWAFTQPFSPGLWIIIVFIIILTGIVYYFLDFLKSKAIGKDVDTNFFGSIFFSFHSFTGHCNFNAKSISSQILTTSMCFLYLILISAYTANLANYFIGRSTPQVEVETISDVVRNKLSLCALRGYPSTEIIKQMYPKFDLEMRDTEEEALISVDSGICDIAIISLENWKTLSRDKTVNKDCDLEWVGRRVDVVPASFAYRDSSRYCSSFLSNVLNYHIISMKAEGIIDEIWESYREASIQSKCEVKTEKAEKETKLQINVRTMTGAFVFHIALVCSAILMAFYDYYLQPNEIKSKIKNDFLVLFDEALNSAMSLNQRDLSNNTKEELPDKVSKKGLTIVKDLCSSLNEEDMHNLILQNQILLSHKLEVILNLNTRDREQYYENFYQQDQLVQFMKKQLNIPETFAPKA